jgi:DNA modification methylase
VVKDTNNLFDKAYLGESSDVLKDFPKESIQCVVTSPEYYGNQRWRKRGWEELLEDQVRVFEQCYRVLKSDGTMFININDVFDKEQGEYINYPFILENVIRKIGFRTPQPVIIWERDTALVNKARLQDIWEYVFMFSKTLKPKFDKEKLRVPAKYDKSRRLDKTGTATKAAPNIWRINKVFTNGRNHKKVHSCPFPRKLVENCVTMATDINDVVLDPYAGSFTSCYVAKEMGRKYVGIEINEVYYKDGIRNIENSKSVYKQDDGINSTQLSIFDGGK